MCTRSDCIRLFSLTLLVAMLCLLAPNGWAYVILENATWSIRSAGDSLYDGTFQNPDGSIEHVVVDGLPWSHSAGGNSAFDGAIHQVSGSSYSDTGDAAGNASCKSWLDDTHLYAVGGILGTAHDGTGRTGDEDVTAWGKLDLFSSFTAIFELTAPQELSISGFLSSPELDYYSHADTRLTLTNADGVTILDTYANPARSSCPFSFSELLAGNTYQLQLTTSYCYRSGPSTINCEGGYNITTTFGEFTSSAETPEPATVSLLCIGVMGLIANRLRRR